jgi:hypothetical protein
VSIIASVGIDAPDICIPSYVVFDTTSNFLLGLVVPIPTLPDPLTNSNEVFPDDTWRGTCTPEPEMLTEPDISNFAFG